MIHLSSYFVAKGIVDSNLKAPKCNSNGKTVSVEVYHGEHVRMRKSDPIAIQRHIRSKSALASRVIQSSMTILTISDMSKHYS